MFNDNKEEFEKILILIFISSLSRVIIHHAAIIQEQTNYDEISEALELEIPNNNKKSWLL